MRPDKPIERRKHKISSDLRNRVDESSCKAALAGMQTVHRHDGLDLLRVVPLIHQMSLSGSYTYKDLKSVYPRLQIIGDYSKEAESRKYRMRAKIEDNHSFLFMVYLMPVGRERQCWIEISPSEGVSIAGYKEFLKAIDAKLPGLTVSKVEYATDQYCIGSEDVEHLFFVERRHLYIGHQRVSYQWGDSFEIGARDRLNYTYYPAPAHSEGGKEADEYVCYERGEDKSRNDKGGWQTNVIDRVRLEHHAKRGTLRDHGIDTLADFIRDTKFYEFNHGRYHFRHFVGSPGLPRRGDDYPIEDRNGNIGMYMVLYQHFSHGQGLIPFLNHK